VKIKGFKEIRISCQVLFSFIKSPIFVVIVIFFLKIIEKRAKIMRMARKTVGSLKKD